jgi:signal transduction histidine kinase
MNDLLARLSRERPGGEAPAVQPIEIGDLAARVAAVKARIHPLNVAGSGLAFADGARLEQALVHLVQNAIEASDLASPVELRVGSRGAEVVLEIIDHGHGMSAEFIRTRLFQPFVSTKEGGFGIGAYEARALVLAMGGRLDVVSEEGVGTRFTLSFPAAEDRRLVERLVA